LCESGSGLAKARLADEPDRPYLLRAPTAGGRGRPLVIALHGSGSGPEQLEAMTHLAARGASAGVNVVLPSAANRLWSNFSLNDEPYLDAVIDAALRRTCADPHALVLTGFSNGGDEAQTIGCVEAARWRAVAVVSSSTVPERCVQGGPPVTLLRVHGLVDRTSPFDGRTGDDPRDPVLPATARWAAYDGCHGAPVRSGTSRRWSGCADGTTVELLALPGVGHAWPSQPDVTGRVLALALGRKAASGR
jgi:polyhydroxybutyrate depolymerase